MVAVLHKFDHTQPEAAMKKKMKDKEKYQVWLSSRILSLHQSDQSKECKVNIIKERWEVHNQDENMCISQYKEISP